MPARKPDTTPFDGYDGWTENDWRRAGAVGEQLLRQLANGWEPPYTTAELEEVGEWARRAIAVDIADPRDGAAFLIEHYPETAKALANPYPSQDAYWRGHPRVADEHHAILRRMGACDIGSPHIGPWGLRVRDCLREAGY